MSKNLFESLQTAASATHSPISCPGYGQQTESGNLVIHEETHNDEEEDDLLDLVLGIDESSGNYGCPKTANINSGNVDYEGKTTNDSVNENASIHETKRNESEFCPSILMNECSTSPLLSSQDVVSSSDSSSRSLDKNIWKQLARKSMLPQTSMSLPDNDDGDKHSSRSSTMGIISERGPPYLSPIHDSLSELTQLHISKSFSDSRSSKSDNVVRDTPYIRRKDVEVGPLIECISEKQPIVEKSKDQKDYVAETCNRRYRETDNYSIESGEIISSDDEDSLEDGTKELLIDEDAEKEEDSDVLGNENEERAEETEDTEWCSETTTQPLSEDSDEDTERASIDSEINNLIIAFPDPPEESLQKSRDDTETCCIQEEIRQSVEIHENVEICSEEKEGTDDFVTETEPNYLPATNEPSDSDVLNDEESEVKIEPLDDDEVCFVEDDVKEVCDLTESETVVKKEEISARPSNRQVSFFEKAADLLCLNLFDNSGSYLSSPPKSVFSSFVKSEAISVDEPTDSSDTKHEVPAKSDDTGKKVDVEKNVPEVAKSPKTLDVPQTSLLYESCSVNELLLKEEEEEEDEDENEGQETVYKPADGRGGSQENLLGSIVDRLAPAKEEDSRLSLISKRLRNRMPHWDDSFNEAFVPQIRTKPSTVNASTSSSSNHNSSDSHKRSRSTNQSSEMQFRSVSHETYRDPITFVPQHVKKVRQFLTALNVTQDKVEDKFEDRCNEDVKERTLSSLKMGSPNPKTIALRARKHSYHDTKKALRLPQKLIRSLPSPTVENSEEDASELVAPGPSAPSTSMEFRSSLGASVRTKPRAFTKAALRRQIIEEASTAKPQFRVKTRPTSDDGTGALAIVITRVTRPPQAKRSLSSDPRAETDTSEKANVVDEKSRAVSGEYSKGSDPYPADLCQGSEDRAIDDEQKKKEADNSPDVTNTNSRNSGEKRKLEESSSNSNEVSTTCSVDAQVGASKRMRRDSDSSATSSSRDRNTPINFANSSYQSSTRTSSQSPPKNVSDKSNVQNVSNADDTQSQSFDEDASCRNAVNFRGVASNRKRLKGQKKHRLLQEIENTSGFLMDQSKTDNREQRALERLLLQNAELQSGTNSDKQADSSVHSSPRVLLDRLSPEQIKRRGKIRSKRGKNFSQRDARRDFKNPKPDLDPRKLKNTVNVAAANRITAKYAAAKIDRSAREVASVHPRVRALIRRTSGRDVYGRSALHLAAALGQLESVLYCLKLNMALDEHDHSGLYPIHAASRNGNVAVIQALLEAGADVNMCAGADGISPLHEAASGGKIDAVKELVARGADRTLTLYDGTTPADCAKDDDIRRFLEGTEPTTAQLAEVAESAPAAIEDKFELYDRSPPLVFTMWLESTKKKSEVLLLSELCDFCGLDKVNIRIHKPFLHIVKVSMQQLHQAMRENILWPALRLRLRIEGSLFEHKSFENPSRALIALVLYNDEIRTLTGGVGISLSKEEVENVKDPPTPPKPVRSRPPLIQKEKVNGMAVERRVAPAPAPEVKKEAKPHPVVKAPSPKPPPRPPVVKRAPSPASGSTDDGSSTDEDVVITGIFAAPERSPAPGWKLPPAGVPRKRPVASVVPSRVQPQEKSRRVSQEAEAAPDRLQLREEYEQVKMERRSLEQKELQLRERILEMVDPRRAARGLLPPGNPPPRPSAEPPRPGAFYYDSLVMRRGTLGAIRVPLAAPGNRVSRLPPPTVIRGKVFPKFDHVYTPGVPPTVRRFFPGPSRIVTPQFVTRVRPSNPPAAAADASEPPIIDSASFNDLSCSPPGSPPLLVPQGPVPAQNTTSRVSPVPNSAPPLLFPQVPPVLLPCPKIADTTYPSSAGRAEVPSAAERDDGPPLLIPSNPPPIQTVKCASELLKKRSSSDVAPNPSVPNKAVVSTSRGLEGSKKTVVVTSPDVISYRQLPKEVSPIPLKKTPSDIARENECSVLDKSKFRFNLPPPIMTSPEKRRADIPSEKRAVLKSFGGSVTPSFQPSQRCESTSQLNKTISAPTQVFKAGVLKLNSDRRKKLPLISFHGGGETISICKEMKKKDESFHNHCIDLTGVSPPGTPVAE